MKNASMSCVSQKGKSIFFLHRKRRPRRSGRALDAPPRNPHVRFGLRGREPQPLAKPRRCRGACSTLQSPDPRHCEEPLRRSNPGAAARGASQIAAHTVSYNPVGVRQSRSGISHAPRALRLHHGQRPQRRALPASRRTWRSASTNTARASVRVSRAAIDASCWLFYETRERMDEAIAREKQLEGGSRAKKMALIEAMNPQWRDLDADFA